MLAYLDTVEEYTSIGEIIARTNLTRQTVVDFVQLLRDEGWIEESRQENISSGNTRRIFQLTEYGRSETLKVLRKNGLRR